MRIVIALQGLTYSAPWSLEYIRAFCNITGDHEVILALEEQCADTVEQVRGAFERILPRDNIRLWYSAGVPDSGNAVNEMVRDAFIKSLKPDVILYAEDEGILGPMGLIRLLETDLEVQASQILRELEKWHAKNISDTSFPLHRPKLAYLSPLPPEHSGISDYSAELLPQLSRFYEIDVIVEQKVVSDPWILAHCPVRTVNWFRKHAGEYDRVLYHIGNSPFHLYMFRLLGIVPGTVVLHDFFLSDIFEHRDLSGLAPGSFSGELYRSHGYPALKQLFAADDGWGEVVATYPTNFVVLEHSSGVILHSGYALSLAARWYDRYHSNRLALLPLMRSPADTVNRLDARRKLGLGENEVVVCSFGLPDAHKLSHLLVEAWKGSILMDDDGCRLLFVGELLDNDYCRQFRELINQSGDRIGMTGWVPLEVYRQYLSAADVGVQLRTMSRGESSASALDCMNYGVATIVNANGSMAELPKDCVLMLPDEVTVDELRVALETLRADAALRGELSRKASAYIHTERSPARIAEQYASAIEQFSQTPESIRYNLLRQLACDNTLPDDNDTVNALRLAVEKTFPLQCSRPQLFVDVSTLVSEEAQTAVQRMVRSVVMELLEDLPLGYRVEPVYLVQGEHGVVYRYARQFTLSLLGGNGQLHPSLYDEPIRVSAGDIFFGLDCCYGVRHGQRFVEEFKAAGGLVFFMVYDLLPLRYPHYFLPGIEKLHNEWMEVVALGDGVLCISQTLAGDVKRWLERAQPKRYRPLPIGWVHPGVYAEGDLRNNDGIGVPGGFAIDLWKMEQVTSILMVGNLEPYIGYGLVMKAFELLWMTGVEVNLVIVGRKGLMGEKFDERIVQHKELNRRLFWFSDLSEEALQKLYGVVDGLVVASEGEGFCRPILEAARHGCPVLARDLPVIREAAGEHVTYFKGDSALHLTEVLKVWIEGITDDSVPQSSAIPWLTWKDSVGQMLNIVTESRHKNWIYNLEPKQQPQLLLDVSALVGNDLKTGIQRVVRSVVMELLEHPPAGLRVEPVVMEKGDFGMYYRYWRSFTSAADSALNSGQHTGFCDEPVKVNAGDIFLGLDLCHNVRFGRECFEGFRQSGCKVYFVVYDLLPLLFPHFFPPDIDQHHSEWMSVVAEGDGVLCISRAVADDVKAWFRRTQPVRKRPSPFTIGWFHLGADIEQSLPSKGLPEGFEHDVEKLAAAPTILMVGTVEPRKGYDVMLNACKILWMTRMRLNFVIVGKNGWMVDKLARRLTKTSQNGQLFWYQGLSDEALQRLYAVADGVVMASVGEGFGLPLIEAAQHGRPILARDLPVFREVAGEHATYFSNDSPLHLAKVLKRWVGELKSGSAPKSSGMPWMTWKESAEQIVTMLANENDKNWLYKLETAQEVSAHANQPCLKTIAVDITPVLPGGENGGAKVFVLELLRMLAGMKPDTKFILLTRESSHDELVFLDQPNMQRMMVLQEQSSIPIKPLTGFARWVNYTVNGWKRSFEKRWNKRKPLVSTMLRDLNVDLLFCPFTSPHYAEPGIPVVSTIYDLQYKTYPEFFDAADVAHRDRVFMSAVRDSTVLTAISEYSRQSAISQGLLDPSRIRTVYLRMAHRISSPDAGGKELLDRLELARGRYFLYTANFWKHKNHEVLLSAFELASREGLNKDIKLVCTGAPSQRQKDIMELAQNLGIGQRVIFPGYLPNNELALLLSNCTGLIFPSLYEGFGLPVIEAMEAGVPVACSNTRSLPEVASDAALFFNPTSHEEVAWAMVLIARDEALRVRLVEAGKERAADFSDQKRMAREYWDLFEHALHPDKGVLGGAWTGWNEDGRQFAAPDARLKFSIVTPSFNQGEFIRRTVLSVARQQGVAVEHVVVDGGSSDCTVDVLREFGPLVKWVSEKDKGQAHAVNKGIVATDGDIIGWLNSDDIYYPGALKRVAKYFREHPDIDVVYGQADHIDVHDWAFEDYPTEPWDFERLHDTSFICQPALFLRRRVIEQHGLLDDSLHYCMDYEYWLRLGRAGVKFGYLEEKLAGSRLYADNKTLGSRVKVHREINEMFKNRFGKTPKRWLKNYAHITMHERFEGRLTSLLEFNIRYFFGKLRWR